MMSLSRSNALSFTLLLSIAGSVGCNGVLGGQGSGRTGEGAKASDADHAEREVHQQNDRWDVDCSELGEPSFQSPLRRLSRNEYRNTVSDLFDGVDFDVPEVTPDLAVRGFENNAAALVPSPLLIQSYYDSSVYLAEAVVRDSWDLFLDCSREGSDICRNDFIAKMGLRIMRRPMRAEEVDDYREFFDQMQADISFEAAVELTLSMFLLSPQFHYRIEEGSSQSGEQVLTAHELANRLSYFLWQSAPDALLLEAAEDGSLLEAESFQAQVSRMLDSEKAARAFADFHRQWLHWDEVLEQQKDPEMFPGWSERLAESLHEEGKVFTEHLFSKDQATLGALLSSASSWVDPALAEHYGVEAPQSGWHEVELPPSERAGILTMGSFLAAHARPTNGSPPLRGVAVLDQFLCQHPGAPPPSVNTSLPEAEPGVLKSNRMRFEEFTSQPGCGGCHQFIDGIGFAFEHYDSTGAYREVDNGFEVDAEGGLLYASGEEVKVTGGVELSRALAQSSSVAYCVSEHWLSYAFGRNSEEADACTLHDLVGEDAPEDLNFRSLVEKIVALPEFHGLAKGE